MIRVLVVDDHDLVRDEVSAALTDAGGIEVVGTCVDGQQAVERAQVIHPDVIVMDLSMPRLDGVEATRQILGRDPEARVVILTSATGGRRVNDARAVGAVDCVFKDADISQVIEAVRRAALPKFGVSATS